ncbi:MAG TPA: DUF5668 domain-containing protein [Candidatus Acidoferrales bacterium]|nr:DUF5668 domain-containing protein [Candidatus Acidoferrales bacterium]
MTFSRNSNRHFVIGVIILILGVILLLDQLGFTAANKLWPLILIYFGANKFSTSRDPVGRFWGGFLALLGISLELEALGSGYIHFATIWPVFLICVGVLLVVRHYELRHWGESNPPPPPPIAPESPGAPSGEPPPSAAPQASATSATQAGNATAPGATAGPQPSQADSQQTQTPPQPPFTPPPPPPPGQANFYGAGWDANAWRQQRAWERFQRRMDRYSAKMNAKWGPGTNWQGSANWQANSNWQTNPNQQANAGASRGGGWYESTEPRLNDVHVFWGSRRRITSRNFLGGEIVAIFGGFEIDLTQADIQGEEAKLDIVSIFGGGDIRVPPNWHVILHAIGIFGGASDRTLHPAQANVAPTSAGVPAGPPVRTLIIEGVSLFGGVTIKN